MSVTTTVIYSTIDDLATIGIYIFLILLNFP